MIASISLSDIVVSEVISAKSRAGLL